MMLTQYTPGMIEPIGQRKAFWWILGQLGKRMGIDFFPEFDVDTATDDIFLEYILANSDVDFDVLKEQRLAIEPPLIGWVLRFVDEKIGGLRLAPRLFVQQLKDLEAWESECESASLLLIPRRQKYHENSKLIDLRDPPQVFMNSHDAQSAGVAENQLVRVSSRYGEVCRPLKIDDTLRTGCINVPHGWSDDLNVNWLTGTKEVDPITGMVLFSGLEVQVEAA
jgi:anaerobic selenocysteine-containing dehydrogenase